MKLTPLEVQNHKFRKVFRGYDRDEVDAFLEVIANTIQELSRENRYLAEELAKKNAELSQFREREQALKETMITAQKIAQDMKNNMIKEAQVVISEAELEAERILHQAHERAVELEKEIQGLKEARIRLVEELRAVLNTHLKMLEYSEEAEKERSKMDDKLSRLPSKFQRKE